MSCDNYAHVFDQDDNNDDDDDEDDDDDDDLRTHLVQPLSPASTSDGQASPHS